MKDSNGEYFDVKTVKEISLGENSKEAGMSQLYGFDSLEKISLHAEAYDNYFGSLFGLSKSSSNNEVSLPENLKEVVIDGGETLYESFFKYCDTLETITIGDTITTIKSYAFSGCDNLTKLTLPFAPSTDKGARSNYFYTVFGYNTYDIPESLKEVVITGGNIHQNAFQGSYYVEKFVLPEGIQSLPLDVFRGCYALKEVEIPSTVTIIGESAFRDCTSLTEFVVPEGIETINAYAFNGCSALVSVTLPKSLTTVKDYAFDNCDSFENIYYNGSLEDWCNISFTTYGNPINYAKNFYVLENNEYVTFEKLVIPASITEVGSQFSGFKDVKEIEIPETVTSITYGVFSGFDQLNKITLPFVDNNFGTIFGTTNYQNNASFVPTSLKEVVLTGSTELAANAFSNCSSIETITLPNTLKTINNNAFNYCTSLENVYFNGTLEQWASISFGTLYSNPMNVASHFHVLEDGVYKEVTDIVINEGVETINKFAFYGLKNATSVTLPSTLVEVGEQAFEECSSLENVYYNGDAGSWANILFTTHTVYQNYYTYELKCTSNPTNYASNVYFLDGDEYKEVTEIVLPETVTTIRDFQFRNFSAVTKISIPNSVETIGYRTFEKCLAVEELTIPFVGGSLTDTANTNIGYLFGNSYYADTLCKFPPNLTSVTITNATIIRGYAFNGYENIKEVSLPASLTEIQGLAFQGCSSLETVTFAEESELKTIGDRAFESCSALTSINLPNTVETIASYVFSNCKSLDNVVLPVSLTTIDDYAFSNCSALTNVNVLEGSSLQTINYCAFSYCTKLSLVDFSNATSLTTVEEYAFRECTGLKNVIIPDNVTLIEKSAFYGCAAIESMTIPFVGNGSDKTHLGYMFGLNYADYNTPNYVPKTLTEVTVTNATQLGNNAFSYCSSIKTININSCVTTLGNNVFNNCTALESVSFAEGTILESVGLFAFSNCTSLQSISLPEGITALSNQMFNNCESLTTINIPSSVLTMGKEVFYGCKELTTVTFAEGSEIEAIGGNDSNSNNVFYGCEKLTSINLEDCSSLKTIGNNAFENCKALLSVTLPSSVTTIGSNAFAFSGLTTITIPTDSILETIGNNAFEGTAIKSITIPKSVTTLGSYAFRNCISLTDVVFEEGINITTLGTYIFTGCSALKNVTLPSTLTEIRAGMFHSCSSLESIVVPASVTMINSYAFNACRKLKTVTFEEGSQLETIGANSFQDCTAITSIVIPSSVTTIKDSAFQNWTSSQTINFVSASLPSGCTGNWNWKCSATINLGYTQN